MGDYSMTCSASGLSIGPGTAVRCLLMTRSPYHDDPRRGGWIIRTPPIRAAYDSYGSIEDVNPDDRGIADLWLRGLREDLVERGLGDSRAHDAPTSMDMTFDDLLEALREGRVAVRQDTKTFWHGPLPGDGAPSLACRVEGILEVGMPGSVSRSSHSGKYVVDEPVPNVVRVRFGRYDRGAAHARALKDALAIVERASLRGVIAAGSGRYPDDADLLVFPSPSQSDHVPGPQWDLAPGGDADRDRPLAVGLAMIREDVWQALVAFPHSDRVMLDCDQCGQRSSQHGRDRTCPNKSIDERPLREHAAGSTYSHGPVFLPGVEHVVVPVEYGETVWYGASAFSESMRDAWAGIVRHFRGPHDPLPDDGSLDRMMAGLREKMRAEEDRVAQLPAVERERIEADRSAERLAWRAEEQRKIEHPRFGDFWIGHHLLGDQERLGAWILVDSTPGVIGISHHLSMLLADRAEPPDGMLDALAELSMVRHALMAVGAHLSPAASSGPQYADWPEVVRYHRTLLRIAQGEAEELQRDDPDAVPCMDTLDGVIESLRSATARVSRSCRSRAKWQSIPSHDASPSPLDVARLLDRCARWLIASGTMKRRTDQLLLIWPFGVLARRLGLE